GEDIIVPAYATLQTEAAELETAIGEYCAKVAGGDLSAVQTSWQEAMLAWQRAEIVWFGPIEPVRDRLQSFQLTEDNDDVVPNLNTVLNGTQPITEAFIAGRPVGAQGFPALEYLLFELQGFDDPTAGVRRCETAVAVSQNVATITEGLASDWGAAGQLLADFTSGSGSFADNTEVLTEVLNSIAVETEFVADAKLLTPLNAPGNNETFTESFRSQLSLQSLRANTATIRLWLEGGSADTDYGILDYLRRAPDADAIATQLEDQLEDAEMNLTAQSETLETILAGANPDAVRPANDAFQLLANTFLDAAVAADVTIAFTNRDGD
ncbi:MAG: imelysin family protein, partial [Pseudomonadota bacterium]